MNGSLRQLYSVDGEFGSFPLSSRSAASKTIDGWCNSRARGNRLGPMTVMVNAS